MKRILSLAAVAMFSAGLLGCRAEIDTDDPDRHGSDTYQKKTTTVDRDGDRTVKTETKVDR